MAKGYKTGGRKKGTPNLANGTAKEILFSVVIKEIQKLPSLLEQLEPKEKADCLIKLLPYIVSKNASPDNTPSKMMPLHKVFELQTANKHQIM